MQSIIILLILFTSHSFSAIAIVNDEKSTLLSIKLLFNDTLNSLHDWTPRKHHCSWTGVQCNSAGSVDALDLSHMNLTGKISTSLTTSLSILKMLSTLDLSVNSFEGSFPSGLSKCISLKIFNASGNNFSGKLPEDIGELTSLEILDLRGSFFEGSIPKSYKNFQRLMFLGLSGNSLSGKIPEEIGQLASLEKLIIGYNNFEGSIPKEIGKLSNLQYLDIAFANLEGDIPSELGTLQFLNTVYLYKNKLEGQIPKEIGNITTLTLLDLSDNKISGPIPSELAKLSNLRLLNLMCNMLTGQVPAGIGELANLQVLELWNNSLTGPLPTSLGRNSSLQWLDVSSNSLSGQVPVDLCNGKNLTKLILFNNQFSGLIPITLSSCFSLVRVRIHNNKLNGTIPSGLGKLPKLQRLELSRNELAGEIPTDLAFSTSLSFIDLSYNNLNQSIPSNILSIPTLQSFVVSNNELTGKIPDQFQDSPSLSALDLSNNKLYGTIPESLASCEKLVYLNLSSNKLGGEITTKLATMSALAVFDVSDNLLMGSIPEMFGSSPALEMMSLSNNNLSGPVPTNGILRTINPDQLSGNPSLCGGVLPPCVSNSNSQMPTRRKNDHIKHIVAGWAMGITSVLAIGIVLFASQQLYKRWYIEKFTEENGPWPWRLVAFQRLNFSSSDILSSIKESNVIGTGANGIVYKADLQRSPHSTLAIKKLWNGVSDIEGEVSLLGRLRHRNIVRLLGYMHNDTDTMFLYEYMPHGSLWEALHGPMTSRVLADWVSRYNVATGVAQGLAYLHHDCRPPVIHRDIKSNNILLDGNLEARIADFGFARMMLKKNETVSIIAGSYGYIAPEYGYTLKIDEKSDIYSFGVVLMELVTGRRPIEPEYGECQDIVGWVRENTRDHKVSERVLDSSIGGQCRHVQEEMLLVLRISLLCTAKLPKDRPLMRDVVSMLGEAKPRRKSNSNVVEKDKPVFRTLPDNQIV